jgi:hypothetical protein
MAFADQVKGKAKSKIAANSKTRPEFKKQQQSRTYQKLNEGKHTKPLAKAYRAKLRAGKKVNKAFKALDSKINSKRSLRIARSVGRGVYRLTSKANNIVFKAGMGFAIAGAMGEDEVAVGTALHQGYRGVKENIAKERAYKAGAHKHKIARAYNDLKDEELEKIEQEYFASGKNLGKTKAQQAEEIDKIFNDKVMDLFTGAETAVTAKQNKLLADMKDYGSFLAAQGKDRDDQFDELERIIDGIDSGSIGEIWSGDDAAGLGVIPTYQLGEINKGAGRSHKTIIKERLEQQGPGLFRKDEKGGVIRKDTAYRTAEIEEDIDFDALDAESEKKLNGGK